MYLIVFVNRKLHFNIDKYCFKLPNNELSIGIVCQPSTGKIYLNRTVSLTCVLIKHIQD